MWQCRLVAAVGVVPASRVAMDTSSLLIAFGLLLTFTAPAPELIISDEFKWRSTWTKLLHDYQVVGWKYSACSFKNKIFIGIFGSTLHVFVVVVNVVFSLFPHPASYWSLVNDGKFCYCFVFMVIDPRCLVSRWNYLPFSKNLKILQVQSRQSGIITFSVVWRSRDSPYFTSACKFYSSEWSRVHKTATFFSPISIVISSKFKISEIAILKPQSFPER